MPDYKAIQEFINHMTGGRAVDARIEQVAGGCINEAVSLDYGDRKWFVKLNSASQLDMFEAEMSGLQELSQASAFHVPKALGCGASDGRSFLVMENIIFTAASKQSVALAGKALAQMHNVHAEEYGWWRDNTIGSTAQLNQKNNDWLVFFRDQRLSYQLALAASEGYAGALQYSGDRLMSRLDKIINHHPAASLLHGDLWSGNLAYDDSGTPVIFDPAVYYGDAETDLAMTELFGGFNQDFYRAYNEIRAIPDEYKVRKKLYNVYHILNHLNMFGGAYLGQVQNMMDSLIAELSA